MIDDIHQRIRRRRIRRGALCALSVASLAVTPAFAHPRATLAPAPVVLRVMEYNIEYGGTVVSFDSIVEGAQAADADVIAVEEAWGNIPRLAKALDYPYYSVRLQIVSRLPLIDPPDGDGRYIFVELSPGNVVAIANVHLPAGPYSPNLIIRGAKLNTILEIERRVRVAAVEPAVSALTEVVDLGIPAFLLGDFNTPSHLDWTPETVGLRRQVLYPVRWPVSMFVERAGFHDSYREAHPDPLEVQGLTWPADRPRPPGVWSPGPRAPADRIDFIYAAGPAGAVETVDSQLVGETGGLDVAIDVEPWGTDHRAIVSEFLVEGGVPPTFVAVAERLVESGTDQLVTFHASGAPDEQVVILPGNGSTSDPLASVSTGGVRDDTVSFATEGWQPGGYRAVLMKGSSTVSRTRFWVVAPDDGPHVSTLQDRYTVGEPIRVRWSNAPGARWDWIGVYERGANPSVDPYLTWFYTRTAIQGSGLLDAGSEGPWPLAAGRYVVYLLSDDGYRVLARSTFDVVG